MCRGMIDIQCATAEIRRGKKERKKQDKKYNVRMIASARQGGHKNVARPVGRILGQTYYQSFS